MKNILFTCKGLEVKEIERLVDLAASKGVTEWYSIATNFNWDLGGVYYADDKFVIDFFDFSDIEHINIDPLDIVTPEEFEHYFTNYNADTDKKKTAWFGDEEVEIVYEDGDQVVVRDKGLMILDKESLSQEKPESVFRNEFYEKVHDKWKRQALDVAYDTYSSKYELQDIYQFLFDNYELKEK